MTAFGDFSAPCDVGQIRMRGSHPLHVDAAEMSPLEISIVHGAAEEIKRMKANNRLLRLELGDAELDYACLRADVMRAAEALVAATRLSSEIVGGRHDLDVLRTEHAALQIEHAALQAEHARVCQELAKRAGNDLFCWQREQVKPARASRGGASRRIGGGVGEAGTDRRASGINFENLRLVDDAIAQGKQHGRRADAREELRAIRAESDSARKSLLFEKVVGATFGSCLAPRARRRRPETIDRAGRGSKSIARPPFADDSGARTLREEPCSRQPPSPPPRASLIGSGGRGYDFYDQYDY